MRKVVTGSQVAQLRNPDPFAVPAWRSPVYRTPGWIVIVAQLARVLWRLARFARRHPLAVAVTALLGWLYVLAGWPALALLAGSVAVVSRCGAGAGRCRSPGGSPPRQGTAGVAGVTGAAGPAS